MKRALAPSLTVTVFALLAAWASLSAAGAGMFEGRPVFKEGTDLGYYVWKENDTWHVRWTTWGGVRHFAGRVTSEGGDLKSLKRIDVETERRIIAPGRPARVVRGPRGRVHVAGGRPPVVATREEDHIEKNGDRTIQFASRTEGDLDGFDFKVDKNVNQLRFVLEVEGQSRTDNVEVGRENRHPDGNPFIVQLP